MKFHGELLFLFGLLLCSLPGHSQIVKTEVPYYSYGEGIGLSAKDSLFLLNIRVRIQSRLAMTSESNSNLDVDEFKANVQRLRLRFDGFFYDPRIIYVIQLGFSEIDMASERSVVPNIIQDAVIFYRFSNKFMMGFGKTNLPRNRQAVISSGDLQFVDRSLVNSTLSTFRDFGLQSYYYNNFGKIFYSLRGAISGGAGRNEFNSNEGLSYSGRLELLPLGTFTNNGDYYESDLEREESPKLSLGTSYHFAHNTIRTGDTGQNFLYEPRDLSTIILDGLLKYRGFSWSFEYFARQANGSAITTNEENEESYIFVGNGHNFQLGYLFRNNYEVAGRYSKIKPNGDFAAEITDQAEYTVAFSKYIKGHRLKAQTDLTYRSNYGSLLEPLNLEDTWQWRIQLELGF